MARFYESRNIDDSQAQYRIVVRTPDGKRTEINLPRQVFEGIEELQREFWRRSAARQDTHYTWRRWTKPLLPLTIPKKTQS